MNGAKGLLRCAALLGTIAAIAASTAPAGATTLVRAGLEELVAVNRAVVVGEVVGTRSYWNEDHSFIFTDVRIATHDVLKGDVGGKELTITVMGGRVGERTKLIVGGPELVRGSSYLLFLNEEKLPGSKSALTVRDLCQGVFGIQIDHDGLRAFSQAVRHPLLPDSQGIAEAPGGSAGIPLTTIMQSIRDTVQRQSSRREVQ